ncbi:MAG: hypothetical protein AB7F59_06615 [Bdellovibrionales bacterium]
MLSFYNLSGGLPYHFKALRYSHSLWYNFRYQLKDWLNDWRPQADQLILVGPSAGYFLPDTFLSQFREIIVLDPDPTARILFKYQHPAISIKEWIHEDLLCHWKNGVCDWEPFAKTLERFPHAAILFCNVLGQMPLIYKDKIKKHETAFSQWQKKIVETLKHREFASFHDLYSGKKKFLLPQPGALIPPQQQARFYFNEKDSLLKKEETFSLTDHLTQGLFTHLPRRYFVWSITPKQHHLIECVQQEHSKP